MAARKAFPPQGGRWPAGPDEGEKVRSITPVGTLISLAALDSFPLPGGSLLRRAREGELARRAKTAPAGAFRGQPPQSGGSWAEMKPAWAATRRALHDTLYIMYRLPPKSCTLPYTPCGVARGDISNFLKIYKFCPGVFDILPVCRYTT